jgi:hypothetical protein
MCARAERRLAFFKIAAVARRYAFDRHLRDIQTANQHTTVSLKTWEVVGRVLLGLEPNYCLLF